MLEAAVYDELKPSRLMRNKSSCEKDSDRTETFVQTFHFLSKFELWQKKGCWEFKKLPRIEGLRHKFPFSTNS